jgi:hypothetical protein
LSGHDLSKNSCHAFVCKQLIMAHRCSLPRTPPAGTQPALAPGPVRGGGHGVGNWCTVAWSGHGWSSPRWATRFGPARPSRFVDAGRRVPSALVSACTVRASASADAGRAPALAVRPLPPASKPPKTTAAARQGGAGLIHSALLRAGGAGGEPVAQLRRGGMELHVWEAGGAPHVFLTAPATLAPQPSLEEWLGRVRRRRAVRCGPGPDGPGQSGAGVQGRTNRVGDGGGEGGVCGEKAGVRQR